MKLIGRFFGLLTTLLNAADLLFSTAIFLGVAVWLPLELTRDLFPGPPLALHAPFAVHAAMLAVAARHVWRQRWSPVGRVLVAVRVVCALLMVCALLTLLA